MTLEARYGHPGVEGTFLTLTYDDDHLQSTSLVREHITQFIRYIKRVAGPKERYFAVGEYGSKTFRPHYHVIHFGGTNDHRWQQLYRKAWKFGHIMVGSAQPAARNYVTGYVTKKLDQAHRREIDERGLVPEFFSCSLKPTLGYTGLLAMARMLNTDHGCVTLVEHGFPTGYHVNGRYFPFFRRDRLKCAELAGYGHETAEQWFKDKEGYKHFHVEEMELYRQAEINDWPVARLQAELDKLQETKDEAEIQRQTELARAKATKWRRRQAAQPPKPLDS